MGAANLGRWLAIALSLGVVSLAVLPARLTHGEGREGAPRAEPRGGTATERAITARADAVGTSSRTPEHRRYFDARGRTKSIAVGRATRGLLRHAVALDESPSLFVKPSSADHRYGTYEVVAALHAVADAVAGAFPGSRMTVGDLSRRGGGRIRPHRSHRRGLDADVGFFLADSAGAALFSRAFVRMDASGLDTAGSGTRFDVARNWALVVALLEQSHARVQYMIVARPLEELLLRYAESIEAPAQRRADAELALYQSSRGARHDNHFHVRFYCPIDDRPACVDAPPFHPWFDPDRARPAPTDAAAAEDVEAKR